MANYTATRSMNLEACIKGELEFDYDNESGGPFTYSASDPDGGEDVSWSSGTGKIWHLEDDGATGFLILEMLTGTAPGDGDTITGSTSSATCDVDGSVTSRAQMGDGEDLTIEDNAIIKCTQTPSILMGNVDIDYGKLWIDGENISAGNMINWVGEYGSEISSTAMGIFEVTGDWFDIGDTNGNDSQTFDLSVTGSDYWDNSFCVDYIPMIQIETGRRINYENASGTAPEVGDWVRKVSDVDVHGKIVEVNTGSSYLVVEWLIGTLAVSDDIEVEKVIDSFGPILATSWTAEVSSSGVVKESGIYKEFGNTRANSNAFISYFNHEVGGFVFDCAYQSTTLTLATSSGSTGGFLPPSGCEVRVPNVHISTSNTTQYASGNTYHDGTSTITSWYNITMALSRIDVTACNFGIVRLIFTNIYKILFEYVGFVVGFNATNVSSYFSIKHSVVVPDPVARGHDVGRAMAFTYAFNGGLVESCMLINCEISRHYIRCDWSSDIDIVDYIYSTVGINSVYSNTLWGIYLYYSTNIDVVGSIAVITDADTDYKLIETVGCSDILISNTRLVANHDHTNGAASIYPLEINYTNTPTIIGLWILYGSIPAGRLIYLVGSPDAKIRAIGTIRNKLDMSTVSQGEIIQLLYSNNCSMARVYKENGGYNRIAYVPNIGPSGFEILNCSGSYNSAADAKLSNSKIAGLQAGSANPGTGFSASLSNTYGRNFFDIFKSDTTGYVVMVVIAPSQTIDNTTIISGSPVFLRNGRLYMESGDILIFEMDYFTLGHLAFTGAITTSRDTSGWYADELSGYVTIDFQYHLGSAWNGSWLNARTVSNWTAISGSHESDIDNVSGTFNVGDDLSWGAAETAGTGLVSSVTGSHLDLILTSGVAPVNDMEITDDDTSATCDVDGSVTASSVMVDGVKIKYRLTCTADVNNIFCIMTDTTTTLDDQENNLYPIDQNEVDLTITIVDEDQNVVENVQTAIFRADNHESLMNEDTNALGVATETFIYSEDVDIVIRYRKSDEIDDPRYIPGSTTGTIVATGFNLKATIRESKVL